MKGHYYEYNGFPQQILNYKKYEDVQKIEIFTTNREHIFPYSSMPTVLAAWKPIMYNDIKPFDHIAYCDMNAEQQALYLAEMNKVKGKKATTTTDAPEASPPSRELPEKPTKEEQPDKKETPYQKLRNDALKMENTTLDFNLQMMEKMKAAVEAIDPKAPKASDVNLAKNLASMGNQWAKLQVNMIRAMKEAKDIIMPKGKVIDENNTNESNPEENK